MITSQHFFELVKSAFVADSLLVFIGDTPGDLATGCFG